MAEDDIVGDAAASEDMQSVPQAVTPIETMLTPIIIATTGSVPAAEALNDLNLDLDSDRGRRASELA